jgi:hypothetical protein
MFDEESGKVILDRVGLPEPRRGLTPCECSIGCAKGHWKDEPDLTPGEDAVLTLWRAQSTLTEAERRDDFLQGAFAALEEQQARLDKIARDEMVMTIATIARK